MKSLDFSGIEETAIFGFEIHNELGGLQTVCMADERFGGIGLARARRADNEGMPGQFVDINNRPRHITIEIPDSLDFTRRGLQSIDLSPLYDWKFSHRVKSLLLRENFLCTIDLDPVTSCPNLERLALDNNSLVTLDLTPLAQCKRLYKLYFYYNYLTEIDLTPLKGLHGLAVVFLHGNPLSTIDLSPIPSTIIWVGLNKNYKVINADHLFEKITYEPETKPPIIYETDQSYQVDYGYDEEFAYPSVSGRSPNDQRSDVMNPNNPAYRAARDNRANQLNPKHPAYHSSRRKK